MGGRKVPVTGETTFFPSSHLQFRRLRHQSCFKDDNRRHTFAVRSHPEDGAQPGGDPKVQEELLQLVRAGMSRERLREDVRKVVEEETNNLRKATEEAKKDVDRLEKLMRDRASLEFGSALADINKSADDFESELRRSREEMERRQAEFSAWEEQIARERNQGQFFQGLYKANRESKEHKPPERETEKLQEVQHVEAVGAVTKNEIKSPLRLYIFMFLSLNLFGLCAADLLSGQPTILLDVLYSSLALVLASSVWLERQLILGKGTRSSDRL